MNRDRQNTDLASVVFQAVAKAETEGAHAAAAFLMERGASFALTCRVLAEPGRRRAEAILAAPAGQVLPDDPPSL